MFGQNVILGGLEPFQLIFHIVDLRCLQTLDFKPQKLFTCTINLQLFANLTTAHGATGVVTIATRHFFFFDTSTILNLSRLMNRSS